MTTGRLSIGAAALAAFIIGFVPQISLAAQITITMTDNAFSPKNITINLGDTVTFINQGAAPHTATADGGAFNTGIIQPGAGSSAAFTNPGTYTYHCIFHPGMTGTITVVQAGSSQSSGTLFPPNISQVQLAHSSQLNGPPVLPSNTPAIASRVALTNYYEYTVSPETVNNWTKLVTVKQFTLSTGAATDADAKAIADALGFAVAAYSSGSGITTNIVERKTYPATTLLGAQSNVYVVIVYFVDSTSRIAETNIERFYVKNGRVYQDIYAEQASLDSNPVVSFNYEAFARTPFPDPMSSTSIAPAPTPSYTYTTSPTLIPSSTADQLRAQAQALLARVQQLQAQLGGGSGSGTVADSSSCPLVGRSLRRGISGDDVLRLQRFLARDPSIYPEAILSGYFGLNTERAVQRWQVKYNIVSSGSPSSTGYGVVGPRTAAAISILCTTGSYGGIPGPGGQPTVGGFITVSPIQGAAPLTVNVTATVNTVNSCTGAIYSLDFGDNTTVQQIPVSAGNCGQFNQTYPHTYQYGGTYQIKLSAGAHSTSATVVVTGAAPPPPPVFTPGLPRESFGAGPTSGSVPLTVTFAGTVNSNDAGFCLGGCASALDFGDGTMASINLPAAVGGWLNYSVSHTYTQSGGFKATLYQGGAGTAQPTVGSVTIIVSPPSPPPSPGAYPYSPPTPSASGADSLSFNVQFDLPSSCTGYRLSWGDGSQDAIQNDGGSSCAQTPMVKTLSHTYATGGEYTIVVKRGATLARIDDFSLKIIN